MSRLRWAQSTALGYALSLWKRGFSIVPVPSPDGYRDGKRPIMAWKAYQERRPTEAEIRKWFAGESNNAVVTGAVSGIVVVDADSPEAFEWVKANLTPTPWLVKTARGHHCYYRHPGGKVGNRAKLDGRALDVRGDGGYVIGPGSIHRSGVMYDVAGDWSARIGDVPRLETSWLARSEVPTPVRRRLRWSGTDETEKRARAFLGKVPRPVEGAGSDEETYRAACKLARGFALPVPVVVDLLHEWAPDFSIGWIRRKVESAIAHGTEQIGGRL